MQSQQLPSDPVDVVKIEQDIKNAHDVYNTSLEAFSEKEQVLRNVESSSFSFLQNLYKQFKHTDSSAHHTLKDLENQYQNSLSDIESKRRDCYESQGLCLRNLQKLRILQNNYLVGLINGLQTQVSELKNTNSVVNSTTNTVEQRPNNLT